MVEVVIVVGERNEGCRDASVRMVERVKREEGIPTGSRLAVCARVRVAMVIKEMVEEREQLERNAENLPGST